MLSKWSKIALAFCLVVSATFAQETVISLARAISVETQGAQRGVIQVSLLVTNEAPGGNGYLLKFQGSLAGQDIGPSGDAVMYVYRNGQWYATFYAGAVSKFDLETLWNDGDTLELVFGVTGAPTWPAPQDQRLSYTIGGAPSKRTVAYHFDLTNTSLQTQTVTLQVGSSDVRSENIPPYENRTIDGQFMADDGTTAKLVAAVDLVPKSGVPYDPFVVSLANTTFERAYFVGNDPTTLVQCNLVAGVAKADSTVQDSWVEIRAGSVVLLRGNVTGASTDFQWFKVSVPLPVGTEPSLVTQGNQTPITQPVPGTVATNNTELTWISTINGYNTPPRWDATTYSNGGIILERQTQGTPGYANYVPGQTVQVNTSQLPANGTGASLGSGVVGQTGTSATVPGITVITGPSAGSGTSGGSVVDTGLLQAIANNTSQVAQNTNVNLDGLGAEMPNENRLTTFGPDSATSNAINAMSPLAGKIIPPGSAPEITLPFGELGIEGFGNQTLSFSNTNLDTWAGVIRTFLLFCVSGFFAYHHIKLVSRTLGNV